MGIPYIEAVFESVYGVNRNKSTLLSAPTTLEPDSRMSRLDSDFNLQFPVRRLDSDRFPWCAANTTGFFLEAFCGTPK